MNYIVHKHTYNYSS